VAAGCHRFCAAIWHLPADVADDCLQFDVATWNHQRGAGDGRLDGAVSHHPTDVVAGCHRLCEVACHRQRDAGDGHLDGVVSHRPTDAVAGCLHSDVAAWNHRLDVAACGHPRAACAVRCAPAPPGPRRCARAP